MMISTLRRRWTRPTTLGYLLLLLLLLHHAATVEATHHHYSSKLIHRFSHHHLMAAAHSRSSSRTTKPDRSSLEYYQMLFRNDLKKHHHNMNAKLLVAATHFQLLYPSQGSKTMSFGNDFGWLHYTWIDIGTPSVSFLVALDVGSDLLWLPCDCVQCAPLSSSYYTALDRNLNQYSPSSSSTSKVLPCSHQLCGSELSCESSEQACPYTVNYFSENTSSSGVLVEDILHLSSSNSDGSTSSVWKKAIIGCGQKQSGGYLEGVAPDGLMGLGFGDKSVPSLLAKEKLVRDSFSICFSDDDDDAGSILFGDQGLAGQHSTPFVPSDGKYSTYIVGVDASCIGNSCLEETSFPALVDSGTSFTFLPNAVYEKFVQEFDKLVEEKRSSYEGSPWNYCYESSSSESPKIPSMKFIFASNSSFVVHDPIFLFNVQGVAIFCLAIQPIEGDVGIIGQNFMTGYRMVFDRENLKLGWLRSNCHDISDNKTMPLAPEAKGGPSPSSPLPTIEQPYPPPTRPNVAPAVASKTPSNSSSDLNKSIAYRWLLLLLLSVHTYGILTVTGI